MPPPREPLISQLASFLGSGSTIEEGIGAVGNFMRHSDCTRNERSNKLKFEITSVLWKNSSAGTPEAS